MKAITLEQIEEAMDCLDGFCVACGAVNANVDPDCRNGECGDCGANEVYGAEEIILMGLAG